MDSPSSTALPEEMEAKSSQRSQPPQRPQGENGEIITDIWWPKPSGVFCMLRWSHHLYQLFFCSSCKLGPVYQVLSSLTSVPEPFPCSVQCAEWRISNSCISNNHLRRLKPKSWHWYSGGGKKKEKEKDNKNNAERLYFPYQSSVRAPCQYSIKPKPYIKQAIKKAQSPLCPLAWLTDNPARRYQPNWVPLDPRLLLSASLQIMSYSAPIVGKAERSQREGIYK